MQELWAIGLGNFLEIFKGNDEIVEIVAIDRTIVVKTEFFENSSWANHPFRMALKSFCKLS